jgi:rhodanese-related sulfurtransferase
MLFRWRRFVSILVIGGGCGIAWNALSARGIALDRSVLVQAGDELVPAAQAKVLLDRGALFLDARPHEFWKMNRVPGALSLPEDAFDASFPPLEPAIRRAPAVVVYCSGFGCEASHVVARRLRERGIAAAILDEGLPAWEDAGLPLDSEAKP